MLELEEWCGFMVATGASPATIRVRVQTLESLVRQSGYSSPVDLTRRDVLKFLARPMKPWSRHTYYRCIGAWDTWAREFDLISESILRGIPTPRKPAPVARPLTDTEIRTLLAAPLGRRCRAYITLALFAALRVSEVAKVRGEHFDRESGWLLVCGKGGSVKQIPIHQEVAKLAAAFPTVGLWFPSPSDPARPVKPLAVSAAIKAAMRSVGIHGVPHQLRDSCATMMQRQSHDLVLVQNFLRHASSATTTKYIAISDSALQQATQAIHWDAA